MKKLFAILMIAIVIGSIGPCRYHQIDPDTKLVQVLDFDDDEFPEFENL